MFNKLLTSCGVILTLVAPHYAEDIEYPTKMKTIQLNMFTPQAIIHHPSKYNSPNAKDYDCHYWITFLESIPVEQHTHHKDFGISLNVLDVQRPGFNAYFEISTWRTNQNGNASFDQKISFNYPHEGQKFRQEFRNLCIKMFGEWNVTKTDLLLTMYYKSSTLDCPEGMSECRCPHRYNYYNDYSSEEDYTDYIMCIPQDLLCNGVTNCVTCNYDETERVCMKRMEGCIWSDFEYLLMIVMTGFLLILIPAIFFLTLMFHKRRVNAMNHGDFDSNNNLERSRDYPHVISTMPRHLDAPPNYDDLPDELKVPPRANNGQTPPENQT